MIYGGESMRYKEATETPDKILISHEKNLLRISVPTRLEAREIRLLLDRVADRAENVFIPSEMVKESFGYTFFIRQRHSLKEYLTENALTLSQYIKIIREILTLKSLAEEMHINLHHFLFDYDTIFTGSDMERLEFLYTPRDTDAVTDNSLSDMLTILSLHLSESEDCRETVAESVQLIADWERQPDRPFPAAELSAMFQLESLPNAEEKQSWGPFLLFQIAAVLAFILFNLLLPAGEQSLYFTLAWLLLVVCMDFFLVPGLKKKKGKRSSVNRLSLWVLDRRFFKKYKIEENGAPIRIGRDPQWADFTSKNLLMSRKHAELFYRDGSLFLRDLNSENGTYLNKQRIPPEMPARMKCGMSLFAIGEGPRHYAVKLYITRVPSVSMIKYLRKVHS